MNTTPYPGLELVTTAVVLVDGELRALYANPAAETLFDLSRNSMAGHTLASFFLPPQEIDRVARAALSLNCSITEHEMTLGTPGHSAQRLTLTVTPVEQGPVRLVAEFRAIDQELRIARDERMWLQQQANRELMRNLAHEVKNPLGGIRGAAQLLERELPKAGLREYTQVVIKEADRLQSLMDRMLTPSRPPRLGPTNIHEVLERVRSLIILEQGEALRVKRDYDTSLPDFHADAEGLIQALLNIARNAAQAMDGRGEIVLRTRIARQVTLNRVRHPLAVSVEIVDNGPGVPAEIRDTLFYPLVTGREGGTGLGLTLAQSCVNQHLGTIDCESEPGRTSFRILLPLRQNEAKARP